MRHLSCLSALAALLLTAPVSAQETYDSTRDPARYDGCVHAIAADPAKVEKFAIEWQALGGGLPARHCLALAQLAQGRNAAAAQTLAKAARAAEAAGNPMAADFWGQAGNAALLDGDARQAVAWFSSAILQAEDGTDAQDLRQTAKLGELLIDRARARVETSDLDAARADLDRALTLAEGEADGWLLSAALARRQQDLLRARADIARAAELTPENADVLLERGNIAAASGDIMAARQDWQRVDNLASKSAAAALARAALAANGGQESPSQRSAP